ncbi:MAG TPA: phage holin family protein [Candidatus Omnitrophota bacterium]|nr:phage holin family protein [Candidatus Omnitrophota bacterium]HRZ15537.1 phage holin family protein [Candidatus Omnitrophota bacterium]
MIGFVIRFIIQVIALLGVVQVMPGISVDSFQTALLAALVLGVVNVFLRPVLLVFTLPLNVLSLGLLTLVINGFLFQLVSKVVDGFQVQSFRDAIWGALLFSIFSFLLNLLINPQGHISFQAGRMSATGSAGHSPRRGEVIDIEARKEEGAHGGETKRLSD